VVVSQCSFGYNTSDEYGAGMFFYEHPCAQVSNCTFNDNSCEIWGGGLCCFASSPTVTECTFSENSADYGGGMTCFTGSHPSLTDCMFRLNQGANEGGGICCAGGSSPTLAQVGLYRNWASVGGGLFCKTGAAPPLSGCTFSENSATTGGATYISGASPTITACTYCGNTAACGAGIVCDGFSSPRLVNTVIAYSPQGEAVYCTDPHHSHPLLTCCDLYANTGGDWAGCIENQLDDRGNLCADPLFCDASSRDYSLQAGSPCAPFTPPNPECDLIGAWPVGCTGTAVAEQDPMSWSGLKALYR
jgi:hypothetical protein